ncbi:hypothetical protein D8B26_004452 [Coccidioides posadasii str. Silveira]|uniref:Uncharacterized protein n=1 Tax=Coccidioides posadasii (strain RMSCC 757 / Silveira) TaxID=443226 RepID=E9DF09_COCPS|nr:conserved hypothetical protein [Coccidioides posadasii str. Silveira]QVM09792.1 hypothetical protein D8B26_004452 [Coccidioides posadasii str. Silveira]
MDVRELGTYGFDHVNSTTSLRSQGCFGFGSAAQAKLIAKDRMRPPVCRVFVWSSWIKTASWLPSVPMSRSEGSPRTKSRVRDEGDLESWSTYLPLESVTFEYCFSARMYRGDNHPYSPHLGGSQAVLKGISQSPPPGACATFSFSEQRLIRICYILSVRDERCSQGQCLRELRAFCFTVNKLTTGYAK